MSPIRTSPVVAVERSADTKLSRNRHCSATWVSQQSCPSACPFLNNGCYAEDHYAGVTTHALNATGVYLPLELAKIEAEAINGLPGKYDLRVHAVGDCTTPEAAATVAAACRDYIVRSGKRVWTYTHAWRDVARHHWGVVSVLASCQTAAEARQALAQNYAPALVVPEFESDKKYQVAEDLWGIPCPHQTKKVDSCVNCGLCMRESHLRDTRTAILFRVHGNKKEKLKEALR